MLPTRFHVPRRTQDITRSILLFRLRGSHALWLTFPGNSARFNLLFVVIPTTPTLRLVWPLPISLATTLGITFVFFSCRY